MFETKTSREAKRAPLHGEITVGDFVEQRQVQPLLVRIAPVLFWTVVVIGVGLIMFTAITHR
ncbi:hypothetical protein [Sphingomonas sp. BK580]|uniref:hypothetical protein n=1 Tax=Sphingomonas sp. BK580 TaxID=2586972 RepID=UPI0016163687|nr:hypothetical protein [Sphingomonas sp. BK580]MBB3694946.1 hypothetical protein [Sphingomonas sp. BK580]